MRIINRDGNVELLPYLMAATILHRVINVLMIRPYITVGTLTDIRLQRNKSLRNNLSFFDYIRNSGAVEHLAGVNKGNTLLLLYHTGKELEYQTIERVPQAARTKAKKAESPEYKVAEQALKATYEARSSDIQARIVEQEKELNQMELQLREGLEIKLAEIDKREVRSAGEIRKEESAIKSELEVKRKALKPTEGAKAEALEKEYKERIVLMRKSSEGDKAKEIKELNKNTENELAERRKVHTEEIEKAKKEEAEALKEYEAQVKMLAKKIEIEEELEEIIYTGEGEKQRKYLSDFEAKFNQQFKELSEKIGNQGLENIANNVIADFTVYDDDACCECNANDYKNKELTPLVAPISRFVVYNPSRINSAKIQVLNNLYHPGEYSVIVKSEPELGKISFEDEVYEPKPALKKQILVYTLDTDRVAKNARAMKSIVATDEIEYAIIENETGEEVGTDKITFFIGIGRIGQDTYELSGNVAYAKQFKVSVNDATGAVIQQNTFTGNRYSFNLNPGKYHVVLEGISPQGRKEGDVEIVNEDVILNFNLG